MCDGGGSDDVGGGGGDVGGGGDWVKAGQPRDVQPIIDSCGCPPFKPEPCRIGLADC